MDNDRLVNLLPEEYLPEPDFKAFPIFASVLIILALLSVYFEYNTDSSKVVQAKNQAERIQQENNDLIDEAQQFIDAQANARFIRSYLGVIPKLVLQAPDYWEIYNEIERNLPEDTWVSNIRFRPGVKVGWPDLTVTFFSRGYGFNGPLQTYDSLTDTEENITRFKSLRMDGYQRMMVGGGPAATFDIHMEVKYPLPTVVAPDVNEDTEEPEE